MQIDIHPSGYDVREIGGGRPFVILEMKDSGSTADLFLRTVEQVDDLIAAAQEARSKLAQHAPKAVA